MSNLMRVAVLTLAAMTLSACGGGGGGGGAGNSPQPPEPGMLGFDVAQSTADETAGTVSIVVNRASGSDGEVGATLALSGDARSGSDFTVPTTVTFGNGATTATVQVELVNDAIVEDEESIILELTAPTGGATLGSATTHTVTIRNDDAPAISYRLTDLGTLGGRSSSGTAINASGHVTGHSETTVPNNLHAFLWDGTTMVDLGTLGGRRSDGEFINASGQVTGASDTRFGDFSETRPHAFLWDGTTMVDLGTLGGSESQGVALNASGQVTGAAETAEGVEHAFLWDGTTMLDLNALIHPADPLQSFVTLREGVDFNDLGQILAQGYDSRTIEHHAYVVSPIVTVP